MIHSLKREAFNEHFSLLHFLSNASNYEVERNSFLFTLLEIFRAFQQSTLLKKLQHKF